ncbi:hypothetical protein THAOC_23805, partial [Thalassiosira oceanica]
MAAVDCAIGSKVSFVRWRKTSEDEYWTRRASVSGEGKERQTINKGPPHERNGRQLPALPAHDVNVRPGHPRDVLVQPPDPRDVQLYERHVEVLPVPGGTPAGRRRPEQRRVLEEADVDLDPAGRPRGRVVVEAEARADARPELEPDPPGPRRRAEEAEEEPDRTPREHRVALAVEQALRREEGGTHRRVGVGVDDLELVLGAVVGHDERHPLRVEDRAGRLGTVSRCGYCRSGRKK